MIKVLQDASVDQLRIQLQQPRTRVLSLSPSRNPGNEVVNFSCLMTFIRYIRVNFKLVVLDCVRHVGDVVVPGSLYQVSVPHILP